MERRTLDRVVPIAYAAVLIGSFLFFRRAVAANAIFGALAMTVYYTSIRGRLIAAERAREADTATATENEDGRGNRVT